MVSSKETHQQYVNRSNKRKWTRAKKKSQKQKISRNKPLALLANTLAQAESLLYSLEQAARIIGLYENLEGTVYMYFKQDGSISLTWKHLKLINEFP